MVFKTNLIVCFFVFLLALSNYAQGGPVYHLGHHNHHFRREEERTFGYSGQIGPAHWYHLDPKNNLCQDGTTQSPINIVVQDFPSLAAPLNPIFADANNLTIVNNGHTVQTNVPADFSNTMVIDNVEFKLQQFHFHSPSEHLIDGRDLDLEAHYVFTAEGGKLAVLSLLFHVDPSSENELFRPVIENIPTQKHQTNIVSNFEFTKLLANIDNIADAFTYSGSLTTPPCSEGVTWIIPKKAQMIGFAQLRKIKDTIGFNARFPQLNSNVN